MTEAMSASEQVYRHVRERVLDGQLPAGEMITEGQFVEALGVSRTPVREAFLRLEAEGWLRLYPKRGALVVPVQPEEMEQVLEARQLIETHAVTMLSHEPREAEAFGRELIAVTERTREAMEADDVETFIELDAEFHLMIVAAGGNDVLADIYRGLRDRLRRMTTRSVWRDRARMSGIVTAHRELAEVVARGDAATFSTMLLEHMHSTHDRAHGRLSARRPIR
ncbi:GntR family transcriptional regulator [Microbacterium pseudoresistens]|uniref:DNA-binding GntR family transcriptional regulator n=1 Tax=Microbacterium pseudoresistens TaxID=640634 RepID=A0A7Y9EVB9_9MICO|nr:GntR family transcriptional regulator [Microbacterium pseudoresistens]NYD54506.1 DNA-binding GntR family transcriptional regulator [Microbacterium pseudoresistens]